MSRHAPLFLELRAGHLGLALVDGETVSGQSPRSLTWRLESHGADGISYSMVVHSNGHAEWGVNDGRGWRQWHRPRGATSSLIRQRINNMRAWADRKRAERSAA